MKNIWKLSNLTKNDTCQTYQLRILGIPTRIKLVQFWNQDCNFIVNTVFPTMKILGLFEEKQIYRSWQFSVPLPDRLTSETRPFCHQQNSGRPTKQHLDKRLLQLYTLILWLLKSWFFPKKYHHWKPVFGETLESLKAEMGISGETISLVFLTML